MMNSSEIKLSAENIHQFREWLNLNMDGLTWQGRFKKEFESFWSAFFEADLEIKDYLKRFDYCQQEVKIGSLSSWFMWLRDKFVSYLFIHREMSVIQISDNSDLTLSEVATIVRNFLVDEFPHLENQISHFLLIGNIASVNAAIKFSDLKNKLPIYIPVSGTTEEEIMPSMEVTLFDEWSPFLRKMKSDFQKEQYDLSKITKRLTFLYQLKILQQVLLLLFIFGITIYGIRVVNVWYEKFLANKVSIYEPNFTWIDRSLLFKPADSKAQAEFKLNYNEIKDLTKGDQVEELFDPEVYSEESEVTLTSLDNIPKDLDDADSETSEFQEKAAGTNGYRETKGGNVKVYRLMMTSTNTILTKVKFEQLLKEYEITQVDNVKPGTDVPGGVYYNIYVPKKNLKNFIGNVMQTESGKLYENSASVSKIPVGKTRVFIWVKKI